MIWITQRVQSDNASLCPEMAYHIYSSLLNKMRKHDSQYAELLHTGKQRTPISITIYADAKNAKCGIVNLCLFNQEAVDHFYTLIPDDGYFLKRLRSRLTIEEETEEQLEEQELCNRWLLPGAKIPKFFDVHFLTPTAFSKHGHSLPMPDLQLMLRSAASQFNLLALENSRIDDTQLLEIMERAVIVHRCNIQTIPYAFKPDTALCGFVGTMRLELKGAGAVNQLLYMLLYIAQFTGIGVRTSLGMGKIRLTSTGVRTKKNRKNKNKSKSRSEVPQN